MKLPGRKPEKVEALIDGDDAGLLLVQCEAPFGEECFDFGAYVPFQNFLRRRCHEKVVSVPDQDDALVHPPLRHGLDGIAVTVLTAEESLHPIERDIGQHGREYASYNLAK